MKKLLLVLLLFLPGAINASQVTGIISTPSSAVPINAGVLTFTLNQAGILAGSFSVTSSVVSCATDTDGAVVGIRNPSTAPTGSINLASGTLAAATYYVRYTYYTAAGETRPSPTTSFTLTGSGTLTINAPSSIAGATGWRVYISATQGSETRQATIASFVTAHTQSAALSAGTAITTDNNTQCDLTFNDAIIPTDTTYRVNLVTSAGAQVAGFPQEWYLSGSSVNVSTSYPLAINRRVRFPLPILANPSSAAQQSVASPLTLNGYTLTGGAIELTDNAAPPSTQSARSFLYNTSGSLQLLLPDATESFNIQRSTNGQLTRFTSASTTVAAAAAATLTATSLIPAGCVVIGTDTRVLTAFGATSGLTSFSIGDGSDADRFGVTEAITLNSTTDNDDWTITTVPMYASATNIVLTGVGGNFDTTGLIRITVHCVLVTAATS